MKLETTGWQAVISAISLLYFAIRIHQSQDFLHLPVTGLDLWVAAGWVVVSYIPRRIAKN